MYDAAVFICVVLVIAFEKSEMSPFKMDTVNNVRNTYKLLDVDISMINLH